LGYDQQPAPIHAVGDHAAGNRKNYDRKSVKKSRQPQLKRRIGDLIDLPRDSYGGNLAPHCGKKETGPEKAEISVTENLPGRDLSFHWFCSFSIRVKMRKISWTRNVLLKALVEFSRFAESSRWLNEE